MRLIIFAFLLAANCQAQRLTLSSNPDLLYSTGNDFGSAGAKEWLYSVNNDYGLGATVKVFEPSFELIQVPLEVP